jgi:hypothetical protein
MFTVMSSPGSELWPYLADGNVYRYDLKVNRLGYTSLPKKKTLAAFYGADRRLLIRRVISRSDRLLATYTDRALVTTKDINPFVITDTAMDPFFLLGMINSAIVSYTYINGSTIASKDDFRQTTLAELRRIPVPKYNPRNRDHATLVKLVRRMLELRKRIDVAQNEELRISIEREFDSIDRQVDAIAEKLYGLTAAEKKIISSQGKKATSDS